MRGVKSLSVAVNDGLRDDAKALKNEDRIEEIKVYLNVGMRF